MKHDTENDPSQVTYSQFVNAFADFSREHEKLLLECTSPEMYPVDAVRHIVAAALRRSNALTKAFTMLVDFGNRFAAVPLIRLQLDSAMRVHASLLVADPTDFVAFLLAGGQPRKYKKHPQLHLTDAFLHESLSSKHPLTSELYGETNGYVHLSAQHLFGFFDFDLLTQGNVRFTDHDSFQPWSDAEKKSSMVGMLWATDVLTAECKELLIKYPSQS